MSNYDKIDKMMGSIEDIMMEYDNVDVPFELRSALTSAFIELETALGYIAEKEAL